MGGLALLGIGLILGQAHSQAHAYQPFPREDRIREIREQLAHDPDLTRDEQQELRAEMAALRKELKREQDGT